MTSAIEESTVRPRVEPVTREELYASVWTTPVAKVCEQLGVSNSYLARVCTALQVPRPPRGYWACLAVGKEPGRPALPPAGPGVPLVWAPGLSISASGKVSAHLPQAPDASVPGPATSEVKSDEELSNSCGLSADEAPEQVEQAGRHVFLGVALTEDSRAAELHPLLSEFRENLRGARCSESGILLPRNRRIADILTSEKSLDKALSLAQGLFVALEKRNRPVMIAPEGAEPLHRAEVDTRLRPREHVSMQLSWKPERPTVVYFNRTPIGLTLFEVSRGSNGRQAATPNGSFCLQAYSPFHQVRWVRLWSDAPSSPLVYSIEKIIDELEDAAKTLAAKNEDARLSASELEAQRQEEAKRRRLVEEQRRAQERQRQESKEELLSAIASWDDQRRANDYFAAIEVEADRRPPGEREQLLRRIAAARALLGVESPGDRLLRWRSSEH